MWRWQGGGALHRGSAWAWLLFRGAGSAVGCTARRTHGVAELSERQSAGPPCRNGRARRGCSEAFRALACRPLRYHRRRRRHRQDDGGNRCRTSPCRYLRRGGDRKSVVEGKSVSVRVDFGGRRIIKKK